MWSFSWIPSSASASASAPCKWGFMEPLVRNPLLLKLPLSQLQLPSKLSRRRGIVCCSNSSSSISTAAATNMGPPVIKKRKRYRKPYPGEKKGITEEMRFVAMRLRNVKGKYTHKSISSDDENDVVSNKEEKEESEGEGEGEGERWVANMEGFVKYLVNSKLVFDTVERIVDKSDDVSYTYFRRTGMERSAGLAQDLEWLSQQDIMIPEPSTPGVSYAKYLEELAEKNAPLFLCHFYNIYFSHLAGGQVIGRQVSEELLEGRELEFYRWEGDAQELLKGVRDNLNMLGEHWSRDVKNKCLKEATKSFRYLGQIVRLIIS
ncbi:conserved hypothetical protein [Ricinus communis]|uniref:Inactive heme oxygenase 2, chloroplastic n=1 Tax=Ricinus communis TaxID=3988 RepID=B9R7G9_RICCO|nr:conserved hypothetical protein [Ricinus communis]|eukprot:XP_002510262.1 probable inactive heme oxygenase 2, chloroplastic isoform X1 [Ricinus communis]